MCSVLILFLLITFCIVDLNELVFVTIFYYAY